MKKLMLIVAMISFSSLAFAGGTIDKTSFFSKSLNENRDVQIYLPEGYDPGKSTHYPVIYFLHGAGANPNWVFSSYPYDTQNTLDNLIANQTIQPVIVVAPDGSHSDPNVGWTINGSWYTNSDLFGPYEDYIVYDVVEFIEENYKAIRSREKRCIMGHSMGGYGCMKLALKHPDIYKGVASHSGVLDLMLSLEEYIPYCIKESDPLGKGPPYTYNPKIGMHVQTIFTLCGAFSPNLNNPPYHVDFILDSNGKIDPTVWAKWELHDPPYLATLLPLEANLSIYLDCGTQDWLYPQSVSLSERLESLGIPHEFQSYTGDHLNKMKERIPISLAFLDTAMRETTLAADTNTFLESTGGKASLYLTACWENANRNYMLLGSVTGTDPGTQLPGGQVILPLNWDFFTNVVIEYSNTSIFSNYMGSLNGTGSSTATLDTLGPIPGAAGLCLHFAYALNNPWDFVSNPVRIEIIP